MTVEHNVNAADTGRAYAIYAGHVCKILGCYQHFGLVKVQLRRLIDHQHPVIGAYLCVLFGRIGPSDPARIQIGWK